MPVVRLLAVVLTAVLLSACQVRVATDVAVDAEGSGTLALAIALDEELWTSLTADGFEPFTGLGALTDTGWTSTIEPDGGGQRLELRTDFVSPDDLTAKVAELNDGLDDEDPRILADPRLTVTDDRASLRMQAGLVPPSSTGIEGAAIEFDGDALAELLETRGSEIFRYDLRVTMPGPINSTNADETDGRTAVWNLPADGMQAIAVDSSVAGANRTLFVALVAGLLALALVGVTVGLVRRRRGT